MYQYHLHKHIPLKTTVGQSKKYTVDSPKLHSKHSEIAQLVSPGMTQLDSKKSEINIVTFNVLLSSKIRVCCLNNQSLRLSKNRI